MTDVVTIANSEFFYSNVSPLTTNFNRAPYWDDFDDSKNFYKILFKAGEYAVQAREVNQIQTMLQDQIQKFGHHVFQEGSMVLGGKYDIDTRAHYVKIQDNDAFGNAVTISDFEGEIVTGQVTGIQALIDMTVDGTYGTDAPKTIYVSYLNSNPDTGDTAFIPNETLTSNVGTLVVSSTAPAVGYGSVFTINEGVRFCKNFFIKHDRQAVVLDRYDIYPTCKVGFVLTESIVNSSQDSTLLDPAQESSNYSAVGADRFKITPVLTRMDIDDASGPPDYVNLFTIRNGAVIELNERPIYDVLQDEIAKRTMDESGDYYVKGFNVVVEEHLDLGNGGYLTYDRGGDFTKLSVQVEPGTAYVKGYEVNKLVTSYLTTDKAVAFSNVTDQIASSKLGNYVLVDEACGAWSVNSGQQVSLYDTAQNRVSGRVSSTGSQTGTLIGSARVKSISRDSGSLGQANTTLKLHLFDVQMLGTNAFSNVKSVYYDNSSTADCGADIVLDTLGQARMVDAYSPLLYYVGSGSTKTVRSSDGSVATSFVFKKTSDVSIVTGGTFSLTSTVASETFPYGTTTLSAADCEDIFLTLNQSFNIAIPGTASSGGGTGTLTGSGASKFTRLNVGDKITISGNASPFTVTAITSDTEMTVSPNLPTTFSGNTFWKAYVSGDMVDLAAKGVDAGTTRTVSATPTSLTFDLKETLGTTVSGTVTYSMARTSAREIRKVLKPNRYVSIRVDTNAGGLTGPYDLGFSDVLRIRSIRKDTSAFTTTTQGTDVTTQFSFNNGQRDDFYAHATILPRTPLDAGTYLLIELDYFQPDYTLGVGFFSVDSYPINDTNPTANEIMTPTIPFFRSPTTGFVADLRNYLDFRPVYTNTAADATTVALMTTNPAVTTTLQYDTAGLRLLSDSESIQYDYSYYLPRIDVVAIDNRGQFQIINGVPAPKAITPLCPDNLMSCARVYITPYPSLSVSYAKLIGRNDLACSTSRTSHIRYTMRDIGVLDQRITNLENYVSLSLLEKAAMDMKILDSNGLDRFKNGIFVDSFTSFVTSDIGNPDHKICYDPKEGSIRPLFETQALGYDPYTLSGLVQVGNLIMLPYSEVVVAFQPFATTYRNVETTVYRFVGKLYLDPDSDFWVNTDRLASQTYSFGANDSDVTPYSIVYGSWQTTVTGVKISDPIIIGSTVGVSTSTNPLGTSGSITYHGITQIEQALPSLLSAYGAATPVTITPRITYLSSSGQVSYGDYGTPYTITLGQLSNWNSQSGGSTFGHISDYDVLTVQTSAGSVTTTSTKTTNTFQQITSTSTQATRTYTETFQTLQTQTQSLGDKVVAVAPIADIRPQVITLDGRGLKANTRHYVYFDGKLMSSYVTPMVIYQPTGGVQSANTVADLTVPVLTEGSAIYSDSTGRLVASLRLPSDATATFRTGTKQVIITDSPTNEPDATSAATAYFVAQGISQTIQEQIISTAEVISTQKSGVQTNPIVVSNTTNTYTTTVVSNTSVTTPGTVTIKFTDATSCMGYSMKFNTPSGEEGLFLSSADVFFAGKDPNLGVWFEIRVMGNDGQISRTQVPGSEVWLSSSQVNTSDDGSVATNVKFKTPIFLLNNQEYAFIIHTVGINPNYYMFVSVLGEKDILTQQTVNERPLTGTLFTTNNNTDWDIVPRTDLKITFYRAKFAVNAIGQAVLGNEHRDFVMVPLPSQSAANTAWFGESIVGNEELTVTTITGATPVANDYVIGADSGANATIVSISGSTIKVRPVSLSNYYNVTTNELANVDFTNSFDSTYTLSPSAGSQVPVINNTGFRVNEDLTFMRANGMSMATTSSVASKNVAYGRIYKSTIKNDPTSYCGNTVILTVSGTNGLFQANDIVYGINSANTSNVLGLANFIYSTVQFEPSFIDFQETWTNFEMLTTSNTGVVGSFTNIVRSSPVDFDSERAVYSRRNEIVTFAGVPTNQVRVSMSTPTDYLSPVVDVDRTYTVFIHNLINSNTAGELVPSGGGLKDKYISQVVTLADGQDAEDLRIILTVYRPPGSNSDIKVYTRISNGEDFVFIGNNNWVEMEALDSSFYSSSYNKKDWIEMQYKFPASMMTGSNDQGTGVVQYTNIAGTTFTGFKQYQIKIGLQSDDSSVVPRVADLRVIACQL